MVDVTSTAPAADSEILLETHPTIRPVAIKIGLVLVGTAALVGVFLSFPRLLGSRSATNTALVLVQVVGVLVAARYAVQLLVLRRTTYVVTEESLVREYEFLLHRDRYEVPVGKVRRHDLDQSRIEVLLGVGTIAINEGLGAFHFFHLPRPDDTYTTIETQTGLVAGAAGAGASARGVGGAGAGGAAGTAAGAAGAAAGAAAGQAAAGAGVEAGKMTAERAKEFIEDKIEDKLEDRAKEELKDRLGSAAVGPWPMPAHNTQNTAAAPAVSLPGETLAQSWYATTGGPVSTPPAVVESGVYVASEDASVFCFDADSGEIRWQYDHVTHVSSPVVVDDVLYVGDNQGTVLALDAPTGERQWSTTVGGGIPAPPMVYESTMLVGTTTGQAAVLDVETGELRWQFQLDGPVTTMPALALDGNVAVLTTSSGVVDVRDPSDGTIFWQRDLGGGPLTAPVVLDEVLYVGGPGGVTALELTTGETRWHHQLPGPVSSAPAAIGLGIYGVTATGLVVALSAEDGTRQWELDLGAGVDAGVTIVEETLLVGDEGGIVHGIDRGGGFETFSIAVSEPISAPPVVGDDAVFVGGANGGVYRFDSTDEPGEAATRADELTAQRNQNQRTPAGSGQSVHTPQGTGRPPQPPEDDGRPPEGSGQPSQPPEDSDTAGRGPDAPEQSRTDPTSGEDTPSDETVGDDAAETNGRQADTSDGQP